MDTQKQFLIDLGKGVYSELSKRSQLSPLILFTKRNIFETNTEGWMLQIGRLHGYKCYAEIWLDKFSNHATRRVQYTISAYSIDSKLDSIQRLASKEFGAPMAIKREFYNISSGGILQMPTSLPKNRFGKPSFEKYSKENESFYGIYELDKSGFDKNELARLVLRITDFFLGIIELLHFDEDNNNDIYSGEENRQKVRTHLVRERRSHLSTRRKQIDNYICFICTFNFKDKYGKLGENFAEAHHKVPLSTHNYPRITKLDDLITVCSNCHRMLHQMDGNSSDIEVLKKIVKKRLHQ